MAHTTPTPADGTEPETAEQFLARTGLARTYQLPAPRRTDFLAHHQDPARWQAADFDTYQHLNAA